MKVARRMLSLLICVTIMSMLATGVFAHGVFLDVSHMHADTGQEVTVQVGWGYVFLGHDGSAITADAPVRRVFLIAPDGTEAPLDYRIFQQYQGRDYPDNPINEVTPEQLGTDDFPTGGRNLTYIEVTFTPQTEGYYQVFFHRDRNVPTEGGNEGRAIVDLVKAFILVGDAHPTPEAGHGRMSSVNRTEIMPISDVGRLTTGATFEAYVFDGGQPVANEEVRLEIYAHEYEIVTTDAGGRFSFTLPAQAGEYAIRVVRDWEESGVSHGQDFTSRREIHILQVAVAQDPDAEVAAPPAADAAPVEAEATPPAAVPPTAPPPGDLPALFNTSHYLMFIAGGLLLFGAGLLFGLGIAKRRRA